MIEHQIFAEKVKSTLTRAGLPIAGTFDSSLTSGVYVEIADDQRLPPELYLKWRVNPVLTHHFVQVDIARLTSDPVVAELKNAQRTMNTAIISILEFAGYVARVNQDLRPGEIHVVEPAPSPGL
ncbi:hypothetical protein GCM10009733_038390 [Nonomuraea maheshkhaliensis]|uniref:Uncharacterized protein n=1 Tax=Nonomuraea maheshkhaliensis TaxID=419590 RepID=A0ABP4RCM5_9ACTN